MVENHTFAAVRALEDYDTLATSLKPVLDDINKLLGAKEVIVCERIVKLNFYLGGDYKVLQKQAFTIHTIKKIDINNNSSF